MSDTSNVIETDKIQSVICAHRVRSPRLALEVQINGRRYAFVGNERTVLPAETSGIVELLTPDSTAANQVLDTTAAHRFGEALKKLVEQQVEFCTALRTAWHHPVLTWRIART